MRDMHVNLSEPLARDEGVSAVVVEQKALKILAVTDRAIVLDRGRIVYTGESAALLHDSKQLEAHLGVTQQEPARFPGA